MTAPGKSEIVLETPGQQSTPPAAEVVQTGEQGAFGGFATVEELVAAYEAAKVPAVVPPEVTDESKPDGDKPKDEAVADALTAAGLNQDDFTKEFGETGTLSEASLALLESKGFPRGMTQVYLRGLQAENAAYEAAVFAPAGGEAGYQALSAWAATNLTADEKRAFNEAVTSGDPSRASLAVQGVAAKRGGNHKLLNGKATANADSAVKPFESLAQVTQAKNDPRYRKDPAYRTEVSERLRASKFI